MIVAANFTICMGVAVAMAMAMTVTVTVTVAVAWGHSMRLVIFLSREQGKEMPAFFPKQSKPDCGDCEKA